VRERLAWLLLSLALVSCATLALCAPPSTAAVTQHSATHWVASWTASPSDASAPVDAALLAVPPNLDDQTLRMVVTPHLGGRTLRIHLSNRFGSSPVIFGRVTIGRDTANGAANIRPVTFDGHGTVIAQPGADVVSDPVQLRFGAFTPLAVSMYIPDNEGSPTKHWNANATSRYSSPGSGDLTASASNSAFPHVTEAWFYIDGIDVEASLGTHCIVAFGDSITDGFVASNSRSIPVSLRVANQNGRYPDDLQRRLDAAHMQISVVNAGIGENQVLADSVVGLGGPSALHRFRQDALEVPGCTGVLFMEGINDLGLSQATASQLISGYKQVIAMAHAAGKRIWLGTVPPASNAAVDGTREAPHSEVYREQVNAWIRSQRLADGVVDFDRALRSSSNPTVMNPAYAGPDDLHPNLLGYRVMAAAVPLSLLQR
jgi:lysophospholipase L1-like esterase